MIKENSEKRKFDRYTTDVKIFFQTAFDVKTKVEFQIMDRETGRALSRKYSALSKNVNIEGLCFSCGQCLTAGALLLLDVEIPGNNGTLQMQGEVCWSIQDKEESSKFNTGIQLTIISGRPVSETFQYNEENQVVWSGVLEAVIGKFK